MGNIDLQLLASHYENRYGASILMNDKYNYFYHQFKQ